VLKPLDRRCSLRLRCVATAAAMIWKCSGPPTEPGAIQLACIGAAHHPLGQAIELASSNRAARQ